MIPIEDRVICKCFVRLVWFLCVLHCISYLDRINIGFAALSMNSELGLDATSFGIAGSIFYAGYVLCEVPSNLIMARVGARIWLARIMITWGIASAATILATGLDSLLGFRLLVGIAEAGFVPGVLLYITYWFPSTYRARAMSLFLIAQPITLAVGSTISGLILELDGTFGLSGWRWLFLLEGMPAIIFGVAAYYYLPNGPSSATWLRADESATLQSVLEAEHRLEGSHESRSGILSQLLSRNVVLLSLAYFGLTVGLTANSTWAPQILQTWRPSSSFHSIGLIAAIPALVAIVAMPLWAADSDRKKERVWHLCIPFLLSALGWMLVALSSEFRDRPDRPDSLPQWSVHDDEHLLDSPQFHRSIVVGCSAGGSRADKCHWRNRLACQSSRNRNSQGRYREFLPRYAGCGWDVGRVCNQRISCGLALQTTCVMMSLSVVNGPHGGRPVAHFVSALKQRSAPRFNNCVEGSALTCLLMHTRARGARR